MIIEGIFFRLFPVFVGKHVDSGNPEFARLVRKAALTLLLCLPAGTCYLLGFGAIGDVFIAGAVIICIFMYTDRV
jgi:hypothetical protein